MIRSQVGTMNDKRPIPNPEAAPVSPVDDGAQVRATGRLSRRKLLRAGLGASPVVLTVASKPVMATTGRCTSASAFGSINASRPSMLEYCGGCKPEYWRNSTCYAQWPNGYYPVSSVFTPATLFDNCFGAFGGYYGKSLLWVMQTTNSGKDEVARHCAAALLNGVKGLTPSNVLSAQRVREVWYSYVRRGYYEPTAGVRWYANSSSPAGTGGIIEWLKSTMPNSTP